MIEKIIKQKNLSRLEFNIIPLNKKAQDELAKCFREEIEKLNLKNK